MGDLVVGHHPTMPSLGKTPQTLMPTRRLEDSSHPFMMTNPHVSTQDDRPADFNWAAAIPWEVWLTACRQTLGDGRVPDCERITGKPETRGSKTKTGDPGAFLPQISRCHVLI
jgi:hypothetical protein